MMVRNYWILPEVENTRIHEEGIRLFHNNSTLSFISKRLNATTQLEEECTVLLLRQMLAASNFSRYTVTAAATLSLRPIERQGVSCHAARISCIHPVSCCVQFNLFLPSTLPPSPWINPCNHPSLPPKPLRLRLPVRLLCRPLEFKVSQHLRHELCDLHRRDVLADAGAGTVAELKAWSKHE